MIEVANNDKQKTSWHVQFCCHSTNSWLWGLWKMAWGRGKVIHSSWRICGIKASQTIQTTGWYWQVMYNDSEVLEFFLLVTCETTVVCLFLQLWYTNAWHSFCQISRAAQHRQKPHLPLRGSRECASEGRRPTLNVNLCVCVSNLVSLRSRQNPWQVIDKDDLSGVMIYSPTLKKHPLEI